MTVTRKQIEAAVALHQELRVARDQLATEVTKFKATALRSVDTAADLVRACRKSSSGKLQAVRPPENTTRFESSPKPPRPRVKRFDPRVELDPLSAEDGPGEITSKFDVIKAMMK